MSEEPTSDELRERLTKDCTDPDADPDTIDETFLPLDARCKAGDLPEAWFDKRGAKGIISAERAIFVKDKRIEVLETEKMEAALTFTKAATKLVDEIATLEAKLTCDCGNTLSRGYCDPCDREE